VLDVEATDRVEEVFCAVVPDLHRFVLASGVLTGNSFPIRNHGELTSAIKLRSQGNAPNKVVDDHIKKRARALGKTHVLPEDLRDGGSDDAQENSQGKRTGTKSESFTLPPLDWAERAAFAVVPEINF
jgi:hypothetical protein